MNKLDLKRIKRLERAEQLDAWRVIPRALVVLYIVWLTAMIGWFMSFPTFERTECDAQVIDTVLSNSGTLQEAERIGCTVVDLVGGPTTPVTVLVTTISGLASAVFGFYVSTGRDWSKRVPLFYRREEYEEDIEREKEG